MPIPFIDQFLETVKRRRNIRAQSQELKLVKELIRDGKSDDALKKIENLEIRTDLEPIIRIKSKILKIRALIDKEENEKALELIDKVMEELRGKEEPSLMMDTMVSKAKALMELRKYDEGMNTVLEAEELLKTVDHTRIEELAEKKASLSLSKGIVHRRKGELDQALELLQNALSTSEELGTAPKITADALNQIGIIYASKGDFDRALEHLQESLEIYDALGDELAEIRIINNISVILNYKGELDEALRFNQRGLELSEKHGNELISATLLVNTGLIHQNKGELDLALESYEKGLVKYEELGMKREIATCY
ncbi:MAG: tetratricopeptide repeat protein, partial [Candidatus Odinarchaeota archaeon]